MTYKEPTADAVDEFEAENEALQTYLDSDRFDEFWQLAYLYSQLSASKKVPAKRRRLFGHLAELCDRIGLAKGRQRKALVAEHESALKQMEKTLSAKLGRKPRKAAR